MGIFKKSKSEYDYYQHTINEIIYRENYNYRLIITFNFNVRQWVKDIQKREEVISLLENYGITYPSHIISKYIT